MALLIGLPLLMSLAWTFGIAALVYGTLNLMTSTLGLVLFGLGIDYGIHFYARYTEERAAGLDVEGAAETTFVSTGQAIAVGALTTAAALYVLMFADFRGFSEFGFIAGTGILLALVSMTVVLPALIAVLERVGALDLEATGAADVDVTRAGRRFPAARGVVLASVGLVVAAVVFLPRVQFEYDFGALEPEYEAYEARQAKVRAAATGRGRAAQPGLHRRGQPRRDTGHRSGAARAGAHGHALAHDRRGGELAGPLPPHARGARGPARAHRRDPGALGRPLY